VGDVKQVGEEQPARPEPKDELAPLDLPPGGRTRGANLGPDGLGPVGRLDCGRLFGLATKAGPTLAPVRVPTEEAQRVLFQTLAM